MTTTKKTNVNKNTVTNKKSATTSSPMGGGQEGAETKVMCPVCGTEFAIGEHEHTVKNATVIGADSGLGSVYLPVSKRGNALQAAGIDTSKYFSLRLPTGGEQLMTYDENGIPVAVKADDPIMQQIVKGGTVPNRNLFRRWVMSQVFHGLLYKGWRNEGGFSEWLKNHGYVYTWEMLVEELHVQTKLYGRDMENYRARNRWFNKALAVTMAEDYIEQLYQDANGRPKHKCKGVPYVTVERTHYFVTDISKKLIAPLWGLVREIRDSKTPQALEYAVRNFWRKAPVKIYCYKQCADWKDAYKGMGAYATMQNLLRFHGCTFPKDNGFYDRRLTGLQMLEDAAKTYADGEGWRLFGLMKQMIEENGIDIEGKMAEWRRAKKIRNS
jgi:hypothetical protein